MGQRLTDTASQRSGSVSEHTRRKDRSNQESAVQGIERGRRRGAFLHGPTEPRLRETLPRCRWEQRGSGSRGGKNDRLCRRRRGKWLSRLCMVALAAISCSLASHRMLAVALAAVLCHYSSANAFLEAGKTRPGQKRTKSQDCYSYYPQTMSVTSFHRTVLFLRSPRGPVNPCCLFSREVGARVLWISLPS